MRVLWLVLVLLAAPMAGCLTGGDDAASGGDGSQTPDDGGDGSDGQAPDDPRDRSAPTPSLAPGLAWTYETSGLYNTGEAVTIVVARAGASGYHFAGHAPADLLEEVHFDRPWLGPQTLELNPIRDAADGDDDQPATRLFDFPITDGKTWPSQQGTVTAERTTLETPVGELAGFRMTLEGTGAGTERTWTYASGIGYLVSYTAERDGTTYLELSLTNVEALDNATWYETLSKVQIEGSPANSGSISVAGNASTVAISAGGTPGAQVTVAPPLTSQQTPYTFHAQGTEQWTYTRRAPAEGDWQVATSQPPDGFAFGSLAAVTWTSMDVGYG